MTKEWHLSWEKDMKSQKKMLDLLLSNLKHFHDKGSAAVFMLIIIK